MQVVIGTIILTLLLAPCGQDISMNIDATRLKDWQHNISIDGQRLTGFTPRNGQYHATHETHAQAGTYHYFTLETPSTLRTVRFPLNISGLECGFKVNGGSDSRASSETPYDPCKDCSSNYYRTSSSRACWLAWKEKCGPWPKPKEPEKCTAAGEEGE